MRRKLNASLLALTGLLIALGAFGHSFLGRRDLDAALAHVVLDARVEKVIYVVWYFCGGCMLVFGLLVIGSAWRAWHGENRSLVVAQLIGIFYLLVGVLALAYMREAFWSVFVILGGLTLIFSFILRKAARSAA